MCVSFATHAGQLGSGGPEGRCRPASTLAQAQTFYRYDMWRTQSLGLIVLFHNIISWCFEEILHFCFGLKEVYCIVKFT